MFLRHSVHMLHPTPRFVLIKKTAKLKKSGVRNLYCMKKQSVHLDISTGLDACTYRDRNLPSKWLHNTVNHRQCIILPGTVTNHRQLQSTKSAAVSTRLLRHLHLPRCVEADVYQLKVVLSELFFKY